MSSDQSPSIDFSEINEIGEAANQMTRLARQWIAEHNYRECTRIIEWTRDNPDPAYIQVLSALIEIPDTFLARIKWRDSAWEWLRVDAVEAIKSILTHAEGLRNSQSIKSQFLSLIHI